MKRVLIIDDDPQIRAVIRRKLNRAGYTIEEAAHGKEALRLIQAKNIDAAIIDIVMPEKGGIETLMELRRNNPDVKSIVISGKVDTDATAFKNLVGQFGVDHILDKPFELDELVDAVQSLLGEETEAAE